MSAITVQLGQCGNQLGHELFEALHAEGAAARPALAAAVRKVYFTEGPAGGLDAPPRARAVLVDSEPRAVEACLHPGAERRGSWQYRGAGACVRQQGAANNWAFGFHHHGPAMAEDVLERVQQEAERCDRLGGFLAIHSVAGGTGSGVGSYVLQLLRDSFPSSTLAALSVWPLESGEVSVQSYNSALSLSAAYDCADLVLMCENGRYLDICSSALQERSPSLASLNGAIRDSVLRGLLPCGGAAAGCPLLQLSGHLCAHPLYRLVTATALPQVTRAARAFETTSWAALQKQLVDSLETAAAGPCRAVAASAFLWGSGAAEAPLDGLRGLPAWRWALERPRVHADPHQAGGLERSLGLLSNSRAPAPTLAAAAAKATAMFQTSAYVHQYERHGLGREELAEALLALAQVQQDYQRL